MSRQKGNQLFQHCSQIDAEPYEDGVERPLAEVHLEGDDRVTRGVEDVLVAVSDFDSDGSTSEMRFVSRIQRLADLALVRMRARSRIQQFAH